MDLELKNVLDGIRTAATAHGPVLTEHSASLTALQKQVDNIDAQLQQRATFGARAATKGITDLLKENDQFTRLLSDKRGKAVLVLKGADALALQRKTTVTSDIVGRTTTGVLPIQRLPGITAEARQQLTVRDLLTASPTTFQVVDFVKVSQPMTIASPVAEASLKPENQLNFASVSERVKTIATWIPASRQIIDDLDGLASFIANSLMYYLDLAEEVQLLSGDATGENLHGLIPQATPFNNALLTGTYNKIDVLGRAIQQITAAKELQPTFVVLHPNDWWSIRLTKDGFGHYILGDPQQGGQFTTSGFVLSPTQNIFGLSVVPTTNMAAGTFLIGSGNPVATEIMDRLEAIVEVSTEHADYFTRNLIAVRAEKRLALITRRPASFVTGTFTTSP